MKVNVFNLIILDESGSMGAIKKPAIDGLNETLQSIRAAQKEHQDLQKHFVSLSCFNSSGIKTLYDCLPAVDIKTLNERDYHPDSCTPLYDAMGHCLSKLRHQLPAEEKNQVLVTIITDGYENASKEYNGSMIKHICQELKEKGWVFTYIGANQDVEAVADSLAIINSLSFVAGQEGVCCMVKQERKARAKFYNRISSSLLDESIDLQQDYFA